MSARETAIWSASIEDGSAPPPILSIEFGVRLVETPGTQDVDLRVVSWRISLSYSRYPNRGRELLDLPIDEAVPLDAEFPDGVTVHGAIRCCFRTATGCFFETDQLAYGHPEKLEYLLGTVAWIPSMEPPTPLVPIEPPLPVIPEAPSIVSPEIGPAMGRHGALFPYVYMRSWPEPLQEVLARHFVRYPYGFDGPPTGQYLREMAALRSGGDPGARLAMRELSVLYVEGKTGLEAPFVPAVPLLPQPVRDYPSVFRLVRRDRECSVEELLFAITERLQMTPEEIRDYLASEEATLLRVRLFQSYFALVVELGYASPLRSALAQCLIVDHLLTRSFEPSDVPITREEIRDLINASIVLPEAVFPLPPAPAPETSARTRAPGGSILPYAIGDLNLVQQRLDRYALGELAHVESIMPGERRKSVRRRATRTTRSQSREELREDEHETSASANALRREVSKVLADTIATTTYPSPGFSVTYGPTTTLSGGWTSEIKPAAGADGPARSASLSAVRDVVERAAARAAHRVVEARSETTSFESEQASVSVHDNRDGTTGRRGVYRWLNEVHVARVVRYGNRFVLEFVLESPGASYLRDEPGLPHAALPPVPPVAIGIASFTDISPERFAELSARYPSPELEPPPALRRIVAGFARSGEPLALSLPDGYEATMAALGYVLAPGEPPLSVSGVLGSSVIDLVAHATGVTHVALNRDSTLLPVLLQTTRADGAPPVELSSAQLTIEVELTASEPLLAAWRARTYQALQRAYAAQRVAFGRGHNATSAEEIEPRHDYRAVERGELERGALGLLWRRAEELTCGGATQLACQGVAVARPRYLQFFEQAFEWRELSYALLSPPAGGGQRLAEGDTGRRFLAFLEAEYAQLLVPVSPAQALRVLFFLASGLLWDEGHDPVAVHEADLALACELKLLREGPPECVPVGEPWEVVVPTTIAVLADDCLELRS